MIDNISKSSAFFASVARKNLTILGSVLLCTTTMIVGMNNEEKPNPVKKWAVNIPPRLGIPQNNQPPVKGAPPLKNNQPPVKRNAPPLKNNQPPVKKDVPIVKNALPRKNVNPNFIKNPEKNVNPLRLGKQHSNLKPLKIGAQNPWKNQPPVENNQPPVKNNQPPVKNALPRKNVNPNFIKNPEKNVNPLRLGKQHSNLKPLKIGAQNPWKNQPPLKNNQPEVKKDVPPVKHHALPRKNVNPNFIKNPKKNVNPLPLGKTQKKQPPLKNNQPPVEIRTNHLYTEIHKAPFTDKDPTPSDIAQLLINAKLVNSEDLKTSKITDIKAKSGGASTAFLFDVHLSTGKDYIVKGVKEKGEKVKSSEKEGLEAKALTYLNKQPNIIELQKKYPGILALNVINYEYQTTSGEKRYVAVIEKSKGLQLKDYLDSLKNNPKVLHPILRSVGENLAHIHWELASLEEIKKLLTTKDFDNFKTVIHRDVQPENMFYDPKTTKVTFIDLETMAGYHKNPGYMKFDMVKMKLLENKTNVAAFFDGYVFGYPVELQAALREYLRKKFEK